MIKIYDNIEEERERIEKCIQEYGWTSDHHLDWFSSALVKENGRPSFAQFDDGSGILFHVYSNEWHIWSDPLCDKNNSVVLVSEFIEEAFSQGINTLWLNYISDSIYPSLLKSNSEFKISPIDYTLQWLALDLIKFNLSLPGRHFKDIRNARNKFHRDHKLKSIPFDSKFKDDLNRIIDVWKVNALKKEEEKYVYDLWYRNIVSKEFKNFKTARVIIVDDKAVGFNAGVDVVNNPGRFGAIIGLHDYSISDLGLMMWLEDFEWMIGAGYKVVDMQADEATLKSRNKMQFHPTIERKTDTFCITRK